MFTREREDILDTSDALCPGVDVCCYVLVDSMEGNTVVTEMRSRGEVEVVDISSQAGSEPKGECRLKVTDLERA
jgi:hypothetical protein